MLWAEEAEPADGTLGVTDQALSFTELIVAI